MYQTLFSSKQRDMSNTNNSTTLILLTAVCFFAFLLFGITDNLKGATLPAILSELKLDYGTGGNIFFSQYVGFLIATLITGILADRFGLKLVIVLAGIFLAIGVAGYSSFSTPFLLSASLFIVGMGLGAFELGPNAVIVSLYHEQKGLYLNLMAVMHGLGSMIAPLFAGLLFSMDFTWRTVYRWDLFLIVIFILTSLLLHFPKSEEKAALDFRSIPNVAFKRHMPLYYAAMLFYVAAEIGLATWLVVYLQDQRGMDAVFSNNSLALFFGLLMTGRLIGGFVVKRLGYLRSILMASLFGVGSIILGIFTPYTLFLPLTGFFFSIIFPTITASVSDSEHENINTILGMLFTFSGLGGVVGPWLMAWGSELFGLQVGFAILILLSALTSVFIFILYERNQHGKSS